MVSAPVDYEGRAFILHLFAQLCRAVLESGAAKRERPAVRQWIRSPLALRVPLGLGLVLLGVTALWETWTGKPGPWHVTLLVGITIVSIGVVVGGLVSMGHGGGNGVQLLPSNESGMMAERTQRQLRRLQFVQTVSTMSSATVKIGAALGADMGRSFTRQLAEQQLTLPELVQQFQSYASDVAYWWRAHNGGQGRLFIGIDEVDRIVDPVSAQRFLNEVKAVFDVPHCFYLVSVSEEALAAFERRSVTLRTAFDTAFDEIVRVDYLNYKAAIELLSKRVAGLPRPFMALCHGFSGGLPRDLVRTARTLVENAREAQDRDLTSLARALVADEIHALKRSRLSSLDSTEHRRLAAVLYDRSWPEVSPQGLLKAAREDLAADPGPPAMDLTVACAFHATLLEIFEAPGFSDRLRDPDAPAAAVVDELAQVRSVMTANHALALELINALRRAEALPPLTPRP
ncbi:hypothetical protein ACFOY4_37665 [Actinomadura syzygii]|uniref:KAP NTPase domain-containing protein n=1 Tax=Actinomadura syzygii TaxID=1427538 RepID=A0A5D0U495_9ACTN|nr:hypothetical protein [Actinomadura syzygii]TYC13228.1 hypothetical protein FXF65_22255 [Actinomadura syzygii]